MNTLRNFKKSVFAHIFPKLEHFVKQIIYYKYPDHVFVMTYTQFYRIKGGGGSGRPHR